MNKFLSDQIKIASLFAIILVVFIHAFNIGLISDENIISAQNYSGSYWIEKFISDGICRIAVPLFFLISGWLFFQKYRSFTTHFYFNKWKKRSKSVLLPFLLWSALGIFFYWFLQSIPWSSAYFNAIPINQLSAMTILYHWLINPVNFQLWFLQVLFILIILTPIIGFLGKKFPLILSIILCILWFLYGGYNGFINYTFEGLFFFSLGSILAIHQKQPLLNINKYFYPVLASWIILIISKLLLSNINITYSLIIGKLSIIAGLYTIWHISGQIKNKHILKYTQYTFWIFLFHEPVNTIFKKFLLSVQCPIHQLPWLVFFLSPVITIAIAITLGVFLRIKAPKIYAILTGGR